MRFLSLATAVVLTSGMATAHAATYFPIPKPRPMVVERNGVFQVVDDSDVNQVIVTDPARRPVYAKPVSHNSSCWNITCNHYVITGAAF